MNDESAEKQVLIVYYSLTGNTARVARDLAVRLNGDVESIQDEGHSTGFLGQLTAFHALRKTPEDWTGPLDDIETDDLDVTETAMSSQDWRLSLESPRMPEEPWQDARPPDELEE